MPGPKPKPRSSQFYLTKPMQKFGFKSDPGGVCEGYVMKGIDAVLSGDLEGFNQHIQFVERKKAGIIRIKEGLERRLLNEEKEGHQGRELKLTDDEKELNNVMALFNGIELYYQPGLYTPALLGKTSKQGDIEIVSPLATSQAVEEKGGLVKIKGPTHAYDLVQLGNYVDAMDQVAREQNQDLIVKFDYFNDENKLHTFSLVYEAKSNGWRLIDANQPELAEKVFSAAELPKLIFDSFECEDSRIILGSSFFSVRDNLENTQDLLLVLDENPTFESAHVITPEIASYTTAAGITLGHAAARNGSVEVLQTLAEMDRLDLNVESKTNIKPLLWAAASGQVEVFRFAIENDVDIFAPSKKGITPLIAACIAGQANVIQFFGVDVGVDLSLPIAKGETPATMAIKAGHVEVLKVLRDLGVDLARPHFQKIAADAKQVEVEKFLQQVAEEKKIEQKKGPEQSKQVVEEKKSEERKEGKKDSDAPPVVMLERSKIISLRVMEEKKLEAAPLPPPVIRLKSTDANALRSSAAVRPILPRRPSGIIVAQLKDQLLEKEKLEKESLEKEAKIIELRLHSIKNNLENYQVRGKKADPYAVALLKTCNDLLQRCDVAVAEYKVNHSVGPLKKVISEATHQLDHEINERLKNISSGGRSMFRPANDPVFTRILTDAAPRSTHTQGLAARVKKTTDPMNSIQLVTKPKKTPG